MRTYLLDALLQGSLLLILLSLFLLLLKNYLSSSWRLRLHKLVYVRFLLPGVFLVGIALPSSGMIVQESFTKGVTSRVAPLELEGPITKHVVTELKGTGEVTLLKGVGEAIAESRNSPNISLFGIWLCGSLFFGIMAIRLSLKQRGQLAGRRKITDEKVLTLLSECRFQVGVKQEVSLAEVNSQSTPCLYGLFNAEILLPKKLLESLSEPELRHVFLHELTHLKHKDNYWNCLFSVVHLLNWYNPLFYFFRSWTTQVQEQACDNVVIGLLKNEVPSAYGHTLIKVLEFPGEKMKQSMHGILCLTESKKQLQRRVKMIGSRQRKSLMGTFISISLMAALCSVGLAGDESSKKTKLVEKASNEKVLVEKQVPVEVQFIETNKAVNEKVLVEKQVLVEARFIGTNIDGKKKNTHILAAPSIVTIVGKKAIVKVGVGEETYFVVRWEEPEVQDNGKVSPALPVFEGSTNVGISLEVTSHLLKLPEVGEQIYLSGKVNVTDWIKTDISEGGIKYQGGLLDGNRMIAVQTISAIFSILAEKGEVTRMEIQYKGQPLIVEIGASIYQEK